MKTFVLALPLLAASAVTLPAATAGAAPGDMSRHPICASFARYAVQWNTRAKNAGCRLKAPFNGAEGSYYKWCMGTDDAQFRIRSPQALGHKKNLEDFCTKQSGATFSLG